MLALFKHAKNFVCKSEERPLFNGIHFDGKRAVVTNSHLMVIVNDLPFKKQIIHWKTGEQITGTSPDFDKVIPQETEFNVSFSESYIPEWIDALKKAMVVIGKGDDYTVSLKGSQLVAKTCESTLLTTLPVISTSENIPEIYFNAKYLHDILAFFKDARVEKVTIGINNPLAPMKITTDRNILAVLTPIRSN